MKEGLTTEEKQQITTLSADGWPVYRIAKHMSRSPHTVWRYLSQPEAIAEVRDEKQELSELYREKARACVAAIDADKISKSSALQLATAAGICTDKALLLQGQPASIHVNALMDVAELLRERREQKQAQVQQELRQSMLLQGACTVLTGKPE
jgi:hypothetical protein